MDLLCTLILSVRRARPGHAFGTLRSGSCSALQFAIRQKFHDLIGARHLLRVVECGLAMCVAVVDVQVLLELCNVQADGGKPHPGRQHEHVVLSSVWCMRGSVVLT